jgi:hypothetical protein
MIQAQIDHRDKCVRFGSVDATLAGGDFEEIDNFAGDESMVSDALLSI